jgi:hypothetical protein
LKLTSSNGPRECLFQQSVMASIATDSSAQLPVSAPMVESFPEKIIKAITLVIEDVVKPSPVVPSAPKKSKRVFIAAAVVLVIAAVSLGCLYLL